MGNSEDVFLVSVNVFTVPLRKAPKRLSSLFCPLNLAALKSFECYSYTVHGDLGALVWRPHPAHVSNSGWLRDCARAGVVRAYIPMGTNQRNPLAERTAPTAMQNSGGSAAFPDALSVDVEDYFYVEAFADRVSPSEWAGFPSRVRSNCERILKLFDEHRCHATFFVLGWVAEREPGLLRDIARAGHELACHSYAHRRV